MDAVKKGTTALDAGDAPAAIEYFNRAITEHPEAVDYYIQRSTAYRRSRPAQNDLALKDAESAVGFANKRARRELIGKAQLERAIVLYGLERYGDAKQCFDWSQEYNENEKRIGIWKVKVEEKLKALSQDDEKTKVSVIKLPDVNLEEVKKSAKPAESTSLPVRSAEQTRSQPAAAAGSTPAAPAYTPADKIRHDWYQSTETVTVSLMAKNVPKDKAQINIQSRSLSISFPLPTGSDYDFSLDPLFGEIDVSASSYRVLSTKVEFVLKKASPGAKWAKLESDQPVGESSGAPSSTSAPSQPVSGPAYPTSSRTGPKDWDKVVSEARKESLPEEKRKDLNENDDDDDSDADDVNYFFKKLYKGADPDTRRAMMKSYQESNGTALSTNWADVKTKNFDTEPPDGMEAKKW